MSRFYGTLYGERKGKPTKCGHRQLKVHLRGWDLGVRVEAFVNGNGEDAFYVLATSGSNDSNGRLLGTLTPQGFTPTEEFADECRRGGLTPAVDAKSGAV